MKQALFSRKQKNLNLCTKNMYKKLFLPDIKSKRRSVLSHPKLLFAYVFLLFIFALVLHYSSKNPVVLGYATDISINELLDDTNRYRERAGKDELIINEKLTKAAEAKANDMFVHNYWAHISPDGTKPWDFIKAYEYKYLYAGENLAVDFSDSSDVVDAWYDSTSHRENLLSEDYTEVGFAVVNGELQGRKTTLVVQMFGRPRTADNFLVDKGSKSISKSVAISETEEPITSQKIVNTISPEAVVNATNTDNINIKEDLNTSIGSVLNANDIFSASKYISIILGAFVAVVFALDGYYVRKFGIFRVTGHTLLHIVGLVLVVVAIWYTNIGLVL